MKKKKTLDSRYDSVQIPTCINVMNVYKFFVLYCQDILWLLWFVFIYFSLTGICCSLWQNAVGLSNTEQIKI